MSDEQKAADLATERFDHTYTFEFISQKTGGKFKATIEMDNVSFKNTFISELRGVGMLTLLFEEMGQQLGYTPEQMKQMAAGK